jgi:hypothetical protein
LHNAFGDGGRQALGLMHKWGMGLLRRWWWPVGPKLVFDQMAIPVLEITYSSSTYVLHIYDNLCSCFEKSFFRNRVTLKVQL